MFAYDALLREGNFNFWGYSMAPALDHIIEHLKWVILEEPDIGWTMHIGWTEGGISEIEVAAIYHGEMTAHEMNDFMRRLENCIQENRHLHDAIFHK